MPNWCENNLIVTGHKDAVKKFDDDFKGYPSEIQEYGAKNMQKNYCFNAIRSMPEGVDWYSWAVNNWGTKWDIYHLLVVSSITKMAFGQSLKAYYAFDTAWTPPVEFVDYASRLYPDLRFELNYFEGGMMFAGSIVLQNGKIITETFKEADNETEGIEDIRLAAELDVIGEDAVEEYLTLTD